MVAEAARKAGRDPSEIGMEGRINLVQTPEAEWAAATERWRAVGATHMSVVTMGKRLEPEGHIDLIRRYRESVGV
jgi:hypothetical protein